MNSPASIHEDDVAREEHADRWSKDLVGGPGIPVDRGFNVGVACYHVPEFGEEQTHDDQEALFVLSGIGEVLLDGRPVAVRPGSVIYLPPGTRHASRRTGDEALKVVYAHAPA